MSAHSVAAIAGFEGLLSFAGETVTIGGTDYTGQVSELTEDEIIVLGGKSESGGFNVKVRIADFPTLPAQWTAITAKGKTLSITSSIKNNGHIQLNAINPASEQ